MGSRNYQFQSEIYQSNLEIGGHYIPLSMGIPKEVYEGKETLRVILNGFNYEARVEKFSSDEKEEDFSFYGLGVQADFLKKIQKKTGDIVEVSIISSLRRVYRVV
ncbi:hypothetical protein [Enterococcus sp. AZ196]|uniref:hypothetical protein n=1 Tax=Enterococcus sp. AZ196 TaxID=2774659 RepID=UPI003D2DF326